MAVKVSKAIIYSVVGPPSGSISVSKVNIYSVVDQPSVSVSKALGYAVISPPDGVNISKATAYVVLSPLAGLEVSKSLIRSVIAPLSNPNLNVSKVTIRAITRGLPYFGVSKVVFRAVTGLLPRLAVSKSFIRVVIGESPHLRVSKALYRAIIRPQHGIETSKVLCRAVVIRPTAEFQGTGTGWIYLQHYDESVDILPVRTVEEDENCVMILEEPKFPLVVTRDKVQKTRYILSKAEDYALTEQRLFLVVDREAKSKATTIVKGINYDYRYYENDHITIEDDVAHTTLGLKPSPVINYFWSHSYSILPGTSTILSWSTSNATQVAISPNVSSYYPSTGSVTVRPSTTTTYTLTASNTTGLDIQSFTVFVGSLTLPSGTFSTNVSTIQPGSSVTLSWNISAATSVSIDHGIGTVGSVGSATVTPSTSITYTLTASGPGGTTTKTVNVVVGTVTIPTNAGTGTTYSPSYASVTGSGAFPNTNDTLSASDYPTLQAALDAAATVGKPLLIPDKGSDYVISSPLRVACSVIGMGMPTIRTTTTGDEYSQEGSLIHVVGSNVWIYGLHLIGTFDGSGRPQDKGPNITIGNRSNITIKSCILENAQGDCVNDAYQVTDSGSGGPQNVLIDGCSFVNPGRCMVSLVELANRWAIMNCTGSSLCNVAPIDLEPWHEESYITNVEVGYNKFTVPENAYSESTGDYLGVVAADGWHDSTPGGGLWVHHNYGSWPFDDFFWAGSGGAGGVWSPAPVALLNVKGDSIP